MASPNFLSPTEMMEALSKASENKVKTKIINIFILSMLAGAYIGFAAHLATVISTGTTEWIGVKKFLTGAVFSVGLMLVIIPGSELWTGNNLMVVGFLEKKIQLSDIIKNWLVVYIGNFLGSIFVALIIAKFSGLLDGAFGATALKISSVKINSNTYNINHNFAYFFRGIGCNWLVCLAVLMAISAQDITGKILGIFFPIMTFVASGFEHSIANMYFLSAGIFAKSFPNAVELSGIPGQLLSKLNWINIWNSNLIAVTLGNLVGGALFTGIVYWMIYLKKENNQ
jgi:formate/nitrite transporter